MRRIGMIQRKTSTFAILAALAALAGCSVTHLSGTYGASDINGSTLTFNADGTAQWQTRSGTAEHIKYEVRSRSVELIELRDGKWTTTHTLRLDEKGCLTGDMLEGVACKQ
jgi:hypothetical protein